MNKIEIEIVKKDDAVLPLYGTPYSSGFDLAAYLKMTWEEFAKLSYKFEKSFESYTVIQDGDYIVVNLLPGKSIAIPTGLKMAIPENFELQVRPRSGLAIKKGLRLANSPGTVDSDFRGEITLLLYNDSEQPFKIEHGMKLAQGVICPVFQATWKTVEELSDTQRGEGGYGSTGIK